MTGYLSSHVSKNLEKFLIDLSRAFCPNTAWRFCNDTNCLKKSRAAITFRKQNLRTVTLDIGHEHFERIRKQKSSTVFSIVEQISHECTIQRKTQYLYAQVSDTILHLALR